MHKNAPSEDLDLVIAMLRELRNLMLDEDGFTMPFDYEELTVAINQMTHKQRIREKQAKAELRNKRRKLWNTLKTTSTK